MSDVAIGEPWPAVEHWAREGHFDDAVAGRHAA
jgi:hypothetical protein